MKSQNFWIIALFFGGVIGFLASFSVFLQFVAGVVISAILGFLLWDKIYAKASRQREYGFWAIGFAAYVAGSGLRHILMD
jgi:hypothetical protein